MRSKVCSTLRRRASSSLFLVSAASRAVWHCSSVSHRVVGMLSKGMPAKPIRVSVRATAAEVGRLALVLSTPPLVMSDSAGPLSSRSALPCWGGRGAISRLVCAALEFRSALTSLSGTGGRAWRAVNGRRAGAFGEGCLGLRGGAAALRGEACWIRAPAAGRLLSRWVSGCADSDLAVRGLWSGGSSQRWLGRSTGSRLRAVLGLEEGGGTEGGARLARWCAAWSCGVVWG